LLAFLTVLVGEFTISIVFQGEQGPLDRLHARAEKMTHLSEEAFRLETRRATKPSTREEMTLRQLFFNKFGLPPPPYGPSSLLWPGCRSAFGD